MSIVEGPVAIVGAGLIGASWASLFLAKGVDLRIVDLRPEAEAEVADFIESAWPRLRALGLADRESPPTYVFTTDIEAACENAVLVQECGPERIDAKRSLIARMEKVLSPSSIIASSTSSLTATDMQQGAAYPGRLLVAHPMNPPHLVPMVELVAGLQTTPEAIEAARAFYLKMDRVVVIVKKEVPGHLANRLTAALYREAVHLVAEGIASVEDVDRAIAYGPGMRWAFMGPHLIYHLGGGAAGYRGYLDHLGSAQEARWATLGNPTLDEHVKVQLVAGVEASLVAEDSSTLVARRDDALVELTKVKQRYRL